MTQKLILRHGDCVEVIKGYEEGSIGAVVSDPPYGLEFMGKKWDRLTTGNTQSEMWGKNKAKNSYAIYGSTLPRFGGKKMGCKAAENQRVQEWHLGWLTEAYRVLRPGGVIKAFSGTRTYHRMAQAMERAGFLDLRVESWNYGSGFPKSMNISKAIDKRPGALTSYGEIKSFLTQAIKASPKTRAQIDDECGFAACDLQGRTDRAPS